MTPAELLTDAFGRVRETVGEVLDGLDEERLTARPTPTANTIGWLVWHLTRVQDDHVAAVAGTDQAWTAAGFAERFALPYAVDEIGYGHTPEQVGQLRGVSADLLGEYYGATHERTLGYLATVGEDDLDRVVDERWDPPVTLGVRLVSVVNDCTQHVGQAAYLRGLLQDWTPGSG